MLAVLPLPRPILLFHGEKAFTTRGSIQCSSNYMQRRTTIHIAIRLAHVTHENLVSQDLLKRRIYRFPNW